MSSLPISSGQSARKRVNATIFQLIASRPAGTTSPENALPWRRIVAARYLSQLSATKARTAQKIIDYISYRYRLGEYTAQFTQAEIASHLGVCTKTVQRYLHELITRRLLAVVVQGKSAAFSQTDINEAPIYTLLVPLVKNVYPLSSFKKSVKSLKNRKEKFPLTQVPVSRSERLAAAERLKDEVIDFRQVPTRLLAGHVRKVFAAGWCIRDIVRALEKTPAGEVYQTRGAGGMRSVLAWLHIRLKAWRYGDGSLLPSVTASECAEAQRVRETAIAREEATRARLAEVQVVPVRGLEQVRLMREFLRMKNHLGWVEAEKLYPEQALLVKD